MSSPAEAAKQRLFFALWPVEEVRHALASLNRKLPLPQGAKRMAPDNLHLTLAFIGAQDQVVRDCLERQAEAIHLPPFTLTFDQLGFFARPQVVWLGASSSPDTLLQLAQALKQAQLQCGLEPEARPFQTHLTLQRKVRRSPQPFQPDPIIWQVNEFALVTSQTLPEGAQYKVVRSFSLQSG